MKIQQKPSAAMGNKYMIKIHEKQYQYFVTP